MLNADALDMTPIIERLNYENQSMLEVFITFGVVAAKACYWVYFSS
jgi:hypothetical protein